jgi:hypothetical protein
MKIFTVVLGLALLVGCANLSPERLAQADYGRLDPEYKEAITLYMLDKFVDPESARYRYLEAPKKGYAYVDGPNSPVFGYIVTARINAKNRMGGYAGEEPYTFLVRDKSVWMITYFTTHQTVE